MENWVEKYRPCKLKEIDGNWEVVGNLLEFVKSFRADKSNPDAPVVPLGPAILIHGGVGVGKNTIAELVAKNLGYRFVYFSMDQIDRIGAGNEDDRISQYCDEIALSQGISTKTGNMVQYRSILIIDKLDSYGSSKKEGKIIRAILKRNSAVTRKAPVKKGAEAISMVSDADSSIDPPKPAAKMTAAAKKRAAKKEIPTLKIPIILIAGEKHSKLVKDAIKSSYRMVGKKRVSTAVEMKGFTEPQKLALIRKLLEQEQIELKVSMDQFVSYVTDYSRGDLHRLINVMEVTCTQSEEPGVVTEDDLDHFRKSFQEKTSVTGIIARGLEVMNCYAGVASTIAIYEEKRADIPMIVHENYLPHISSRYSHLTKLEQLEMMEECSNAISVADMIDGILYNNQLWELAELHGFFSMVVPSFYLNQAGVPPKTHAMTYTADYNRTSCKNKNTKNMQDARDLNVFRNASIDDFASAAAMIIFFFHRKMYLELIEIWYPMVMTYADLNFILKLNKIHGYRIDPKTKIEYPIALQSRENIRMVPWLAHLTIPELKKISEMLTRFSELIQELQVTHISLDRKRDLKMCTRREMALSSLRSCYRKALKIKILKERLFQSGLEIDDVLENYRYQELFLAKPANPMDRMSDTLVIDLIHLTFYGKVGPHATKIYEQHLSMPKQTSSVRTITMSVPKSKIVKREKSEHSDSE